MGWSGRAPAPPASEAGKGRESRGARHVSASQHDDRCYGHRYREELIPHRRPRSARRDRAAAEVVTWPGGVAVGQYAALPDRDGGMRRAITSRSGGFADRAHASGRRSRENPFQAAPGFSHFARHLIGFACRIPELSRHLRFYQNHLEFEQRISGSSRNMRKDSCTLPYTNGCQRHACRKSSCLNSLRTCRRSGRKDP